MQLRQFEKQADLNLTWRPLDESSGPEPAIRERPARRRCPGKSASRLCNHAYPSRSDRCPAWRSDSESPTPRSRLRHILHVKLPPFVPWRVLPNGDGSRLQIRGLGKSEQVATQ